MDLIVLVDVGFMASGLQFIYSAMSVIERHQRAEVPMFWTQLMLLGGMGAVMVTPVSGTFSCLEVVL